MPPHCCAGEFVKMESEHESWKRYRDELDMFERNPRRWLRKHGCYRGLKAELTLTDKAADYAEFWGPVFALAAPFWIAELLQRKPAMFRAIQAALRRGRP